MLETIPPQANHNFDALRKGLRELGYDEGRNLVIEYRSADGRAEKFPALAAELVRLNVDAHRDQRHTLRARCAECDQNNSHSDGIDRQCDRHRACGQPRPSRRERHRADGDQHRHRGETARAAQGDGAGRRPDCGPVQYGQPHLCAALEAGRARGAGTGHRKPTSRRTKAGGHRTRIHRRDSAKAPVRCS